MRKAIKKSKKLHGVCYDIRGPVLDAALRLEEQGAPVAKLNIGNPAHFGLCAPREVVREVIDNIDKAQPYGDSRGLPGAREAVRRHCRRLGMDKVETDHVLLGNGASELIQIAVQALLNDGEECLLPAPDYPLWSACVLLSGGVPVHYRCREENGWQPDPEDIRAKITERTRAIVVINPNNPTGAVYGRDTLRALADIAEEFDLVLFADEIYEQVVFDDAAYIPLATLAPPSLLCVTFNGLSKSHRLAGFRAGWAVVTGDLERAEDYLEGLNILSSMRLCANMPAQYALPPALEDPENISAMTRPGGRLYEQRELAWQRLADIPGVECQKPRGAFYFFPKVPVWQKGKPPVKNDEQFVLDFLEEEKVLLVAGSAFNTPDQTHIRLTFLPEKGELGSALERLARFIEKGAA